MKYLEARAHALMVSLRGKQDCGDTEPAHHDDRCKRVQSVLRSVLEDAAKVVDEMRGGNETDLRSAVARIRSLAAREVPETGTPGSRP